MNFIENSPANITGSYGHN